MKKRMIALAVCFCMVFMILPGYAIEDGPSASDETPIEGTLCVHESDPEECTQCNAPDTVCDHGNDPADCTDCVTGEDPEDPAPALCDHGEDPETCEDCKTIEEPEVPKDPAPALCDHGNEALTCEDCSEAMESLCEHGNEAESCEDCKGAGVPDAPGGSATDKSGSLYDALMNAQSMDEVEAIIGGIDDEEGQSFLASLTEEETQALQSHLTGLADAEIQELPVTVPYTQAGPLMPPVTVAASARRSFGVNSIFSSTSAGVDADGLVTSKNVTYDSVTGKYTITLEAYTTGEVTTETTTSPVDIVLVLDQSGSMAYNFDGNTTSTNSARRQYAMKEAVTNFITEVAGKYDEDTSDHRISIVTFGSNASTLENWTFVDSAGETLLVDKVANLTDSPSGSTNTAAGMDEAQKLIDTPDYTGQNTQRQQVVIVFTDGEPDFDLFNSNANSAIQTANYLKDKSCTVYSIGIFEGANPTASIGGRLWELNGTKRSNRFMHYVSSNFPDATSLTNDETGSQTAGYYLTAANAADLDSIFQSISQQISQASISLGSTTVIRDVISDAFTLPAGADASSIKLYTADYDGTAFGSRAAADSSVTATLSDGKTIDVTGFDFDANFVSDTGRSESDPTAAGSFFGRKLIIEFEVEAEDSFFGGGDVPTNGTDSGVYDGEDVVENFEVPTVDRPMNYEIASQNLVIPVGTSVNLSGLLDYAVGYKPNRTNNAHVNIEYKLWDSAGTTLIGTYTIAAGSATGTWVWETGYANGDSGTLTECTGYTLSCTVTDASSDVEMTPAIVSETPAVHVVVPTITWKDSSVEAGTEVSPLTDNFVSITWADKNGTTHTLPAYTDPTVSYRLTPVIDANGKITITAETAFDVTVWYGTTDITQYATFIRQGGTDCPSTCADAHLGSEADTPEFVIHLSQFELEITKTITGGGQPTQSFIFDVKKGSETVATIVMTPDEFTSGSCEKTVTGLSAGTYTVTERGDWSWGYTLDSSNDQVATAADNEVTFVNKASGENWFGASHVIANVFDLIGGITP